MRENRENGEAHHTVMGALNNSFSIGIGSGIVLVGVRTEKDFSNAPGLAHGAVETGRFSAFLFFFLKSGGLAETKFTAKSEISNNLPLHGKFSNVY